MLVGIEELPVWFRFRAFSSLPASLTPRRRLGSNTSEMKLPRTSQSVSRLNLSSDVDISSILNRGWMLQAPDTQIHQIRFSPGQERLRDRVLGEFSFMNDICPRLGGNMMGKDSQEPFFFVVRDDLLHPIVNGNKARKLDAVLPMLMDSSVTDVVTCGGCQSAHTAAVAVSCAERGLKSHLLLRGEQPKVLTGYNLISTLYGNVTYVPRSVYANRKDMLMNHAKSLVGYTGHVLLCNDILETPPINTTSLAPSVAELEASTTALMSMQKVVVLNEGAGDVVALLGVIRLVKYLCQDHLLGKEKTVNLVVDAGTGTTAIGLGIAAVCLGLPWKVTAVMLADTVGNYKKKEKDLLSEFVERYGLLHIDHNLLQLGKGVVHWVDRPSPRKFGNILEGEIERCSQIARQTGVLVDPIYTLAAWEESVQLCLGEASENTIVVMLHTGGTLGLFGLAQRYDKFFQTPKME